MDAVQDTEWFKPAPWWRRLAPWAVAFVVLAFAVALFASPYFALGSFKLAAKRGDTARIEQLADIPALRASLKVQLAAALAGHEGGGLKSAMLLSDSFIDALLTPHNLIAFIGGARLTPATTQPPPAADAGSPSAAQGPPPAPADPIAVTGGYAGVSRFEVSIGRAGEGRPTVFSFHRRGLFGWVLSDIRLSEAALRQVAQD